MSDEKPAHADKDEHEGMAGEGAPETTDGGDAPKLTEGDKEPAPALEAAPEGAPALPAPKEEGEGEADGAKAVAATDTAEVTDDSEPPGGEGAAEEEKVPAAVEEPKPKERTFADELREEYGDVETADMDDLPDLERKRDRLNAMAEEHKSKRDRMNSVTKQLAEERDRLNAQVRDLVQRANDHRNNRNKLNIEVRESKKLRDERNKKSAELNEIVMKLKKEKIVETGGPSLSRLRKELNDLDFKMMTSVLTPDKEKEMMANIARIQAMIREQEQKMEEHREIRQAVRDARQAKEEAESQHRLVSDLARRAQSEHDSMIELYETADELRKQADAAQQKFIANKQLADAEHKQHIELIRKVHDYDKFISGLRRRERKARKDRQETVQKKVTEDIVEKFKKGQKLSTEDLLSLQTERF